MKFDRDTKYSGHSNEKVIELEQRYERLKQEQGATWFEIQKIQDNCKHEYQFYARGPYEDTYKCAICGKEKEL